MDQTQRRSNPSRLWLAGMMFVTGPGAASDEDARRPIVISAGKVEQSVAETAAGVSVIDREQLEAAVATGVNEVAREAPNLHVYSEGSGGRSTYVFLRGIGSVLNDPAVGFYVDGVPRLREGTFDVDLLGIERVEVLRGPQGTLYGRNALGGIVHFLTQDPWEQTGAQTRLSTGSFGARRISQALGSAFNDHSAAFGLHAAYDDADGFIVNDLSGEPANRHRASSARATLAARIGSRLDLTLRLDAADADHAAWALNPRAVVDANPHRVQLNSDGYNRKTERGTSLTLDYEAAGLKLTSISALRGWDNSVHADLDYSPLDLVVNFLEEKQTQFTQELRLSPADTGPGASWLLGLFYADEDFEKDLTVEYRDAAADVGLVPFALEHLSLTRFDTRNFAVFGEYTLPFGHSDLTFGLRYETEHRHVRHSKEVWHHGAAVPGTAETLHHALEDRFFLPKLVLSHHWSDATLIYAGLSAGYRSGGFNYTQSDPESALFGPEKAHSLELGAKGGSAGFDWQVSAFYTRIEDQQVNQWTQGFLALVRNAARSFSRGLELEMDWRIDDHWRINGGYGYTDARYGEFRDPVLQADFSGKRLPFVPAHNLHLAAEYRRPSVDGFTWKARMEIQGDGDVYWNENNRVHQPFYLLLNARLSLESDGWELYLWGKNLLDERYESGGIVDPRLGERVIQGAPRSVGIGIEIDY